MRYRYRSYDELKDSGVEWIGKIPKDWEVSKIKYILEKLISGGTPDTNNELFWGDKNINNIPWVSISDMSSVDYVDNTEKYITLDGLQNKKLSIIKKGNLIYSIYATIGKVSELNIDATINQALLGLECNNKINKTYLKYVLKSMERYVISLSSSNTQNNLNAEKVKNMIIPLSIEQEKIVNFLDKNISQFNLIISKKEKLIERLEESKKSLISEVATGKVKVVKTDDGYELVKRSSEEMKDSGVEWLGEIPKDWDLKAIKYLFQLRNERNYKEMKDVQLLSLFTSLGVMKKGEVEARGNKVRTVEVYKEVYPNDIVVNIILAWMGAIGMSEHRGVISPAYDIYKPINNNIVSKYYHYLSRTPRFSGECYKKGRGIMDMRWRTYSDEFKSIIVTSPKVEEKNNIVKCLDEKINSIDNLIKSTQKQIEKLKEAKQSLISEAVTGKIEILD